MQGTKTRTKSFQITGHAVCSIRLYINLINDGGHFIRVEFA